MPIVFKIPGDPKVQKNDLVIRKKKTKNKYISFIAHSEALLDEKIRVSLAMYKQYLAQGYKAPIDYLIIMDFKFYVDSHHEPDCDNLLALPLDAAQGVKVKGMVRGMLIGKILKDDKLVRKIICEKIVKGDTKYVGEPRTEIEIESYER